MLNKYVHNVLKTWKNNKITHFPVTYVYIYWIVYYVTIIFFF